MKANREQMLGVGVGVVACAACCAGPLIGLFAAVSLGTAVAWGGSVVAGVIVALVGVLVVRRRRRVRQSACAVTSMSVPVAAPTVRART